MLNMKLTQFFKFSRHSAMPGILSFDDDLNDGNDDVHLWI